MKDVYKRLPELREIEEEIVRLGPRCDSSVLAKVGMPDKKTPSVPVYAIEIGSKAPEAPVFLIVGGVHGLERIGTHVVLSFLKTVSALLQWDRLIQEALTKARMVFIPLINPGGMFLETRSNPEGVDLMRNAPVEAEVSSDLKLFAGHRLSKFLPWYRGEQNQTMQIESQAVVDLVVKKILGRNVVISVDVHSGFGMVDRLWFPYAKTQKPFPHIAQVYRLKKLLDKTYPHHIYHVEPQSKQYVTHGDLWDYLYDENQSSHPKTLYLPLCLELGSWLWVKKNPRQMLSMLGVFNPLETHRYQRILRRHLLLMDFLWRATISTEEWVGSSLSQDASDEKKARDLWYKE